MKRNEIFPSTYYNSQDVREGPLLLTIDFANMESVGEGGSKQEKLVIHFKEEDSKLLVVTPTKFDAIALIAKSDETDDWPGVKIVLEAGKASFQGKLVDSINIRAPRKPASPKRPVAPPGPEAESQFDGAIERLRAEIERSYSKWKTSAQSESDGPDPGHTDCTSAHGNAYDWEYPDWSILEDRRGELPDFPIDTLSEKCRDWVERAAHGAGATIAHVAVPMLGIFSSLIGTARRVESLDAELTGYLLETLVKAGWLRKDTAQTRGRSRHRWRVNPRLFLTSDAENAGTAQSHPP
jgi:hypothetical protein